MGRHPAAGRAAVAGEPPPASAAEWASGRGRWTRRPAGSDDEAAARAIMMARRGESPEANFTEVVA